MGLEKLLRQYSVWQTLLTVNSVTPSNEDQNNSGVDINNTEQWKLLFRVNSHDYNPHSNYCIQDLNILQIEN
ncbi:unnamed protein product [Rotaria sordida]|uniref:Uncharacterized protein n=1 Tax=Rotaria sordida TaxID=392033 RepID=A0A816BAG5_9BILA|nr:unnamed protein product [Rotaria sordida]CAF1607914.1 unnamed protein product [Rotaria sordida]